MLRLKLFNEGQETVISEFNNAASLRQYLIDHSESLFSWQKEQDPQFQIPTFDGCTQIHEIVHDLNRANLGWYDLTVEDEAGYQII